MPRLAVPLLRTFLHRASHSPPPSFFALRILPQTVPQVTAPRLLPSLHTLSVRTFASTSPPRSDKPVWPYLYKPFDRMPHLDPYFKQVDSLQGVFIERLREAVGIPSISSEDARRPDVVKVSIGKQTPQDCTCHSCCAIHNAESEERKSNAGLAHCTISVLYITKRRYKMKVAGFACYLRHILM